MLHTPNLPTSLSVWASCVQRLNRYKKFREFLLSFERPNRWPGGIGYELLMQNTFPSQSLRETYYDLTTKRPSFALLEIEREIEFAEQHIFKLLANFPCLITDVMYRYEDMFNLVGETFLVGFYNRGDRYVRYYKNKEDAPEELQNYEIKKIFMTIESVSKNGKCLVYNFKKITSLNLLELGFGREIVPNTVLTRKEIIEKNCELLKKLGVRYVKKTLVNELLKTEPDQEEAKFYSEFSQNLKMDFEEDLIEFENSDDVDDDEEDYEEDDCGGQFEGNNYFEVTMNLDDDDFAY